MSRESLIQVRRGTATQWYDTNPTLAVGEIGFETDTGKLKVGTASTAWNSLPYVTDASDVSGVFSSGIFSGNTSTDLVKITQAGTGNAFVVEDVASDTTPFVINASGNVGVGTSSPSTALHVVGTVTATTFAGSGASLTSIPYSGLTGTVPTWNQSTTGNASTASAVAAANLTGATLAAGVTGSSLTSVGTLTVLNVAGLTVGTKNFGNTHFSSFAAKADSSAQGLLAGYSFYPTFVGVAGDNDARRAADIYAGYNSGAWGNEYLSFGVGTGAANDVGAKTTERMRISGAGDVTIGTANNYGKVNIASSIAIHGTDQIINFVNASNTRLGYLYHDATNITLLNQVAGYVAVGTNNTERVRITSAGRVGIGSNAPTEQLQVAGTTHLTGAGTFPTTGTGIEFTPSVAGGTNYIQAFSRDAGTWQTLAINSGLTAFSTAGTERMRITSAGLVGIGTSSPTSKLDLVGNQVIRAAATQDGIQLAGRAGGDASWTVKLIPAALAAHRTLTLPNVDGTVVTTGDTGSVTSTMIAGVFTTGDSSNNTITISTSAPTGGSSGDIWLKY